MNGVSLWDGIHINYRLSLAIIMLYNECHTVSRMCTIQIYKLCVCCVCVCVCVCVCAGQAEVTFKDAMKFMLTGGMEQVCIYIIRVTIHTQYNTIFY